MKNVSHLTRIAARGAAVIVPAVAIVMMLAWLLPVAAAAPSAVTSTAVETVGLVAAPASELQLLIDAASPGATVHFPAGHYVGQLKVNKNLTIIGAGEASTIVQSSATMAPDVLGNVFVIEVTTHANVEIAKLTVRVTEQCMLSNSIGVATGGGIGVGGNSTVSVLDDRVMASGPAPQLNDVCNTTTGSPGMFSFGRAVSIGFDDGPTDGSMHQVEGHGTVSNVTAVGFDIFSISIGGVRGPTGSTATVIDNTVRVGPGPYTAAYGIVAYGVSIIADNHVTGEAGSDGGIAVVDTSADVTSNVVSDFSCYSAPFPISPPCGVDPLYDDQDLGIFLAGITPGTLVEYNTIQHVDSGILVDGPEAAAAITHNHVTSSTFYALEVLDARQTFANNVLHGGMYAIAVAAAATNATGILSHNTISGDTVSLALIEENYPWVAQVVVDK
jgi:Right handed beta helix region